jgi:hypothetical protein
MEGIFRILRPARSAYLFEVYRDVDSVAFHSASRSRLHEFGPIRRPLGPYALRKALRFAYPTEKYVGMIKNRVLFIASRSRGYQSPQLQCGCKSPLPRRIRGNA